MAGITSPEGPIGKIVNRFIHRTPVPQPEISILENERFLRSNDLLAKARRTAKEKTQDQLKREILGEEQTEPDPNPYLRKGK